MTYTSPAVVIDNGSHTTKAGFALDDLPSLVFNSNYVVDSNSKVQVGDRQIDENPESEIMTFMENGLIYNFDNIVHNWQYVYDNIDNNNPINAKEFPLMLTEQPWNTSKNKLATTQIAFETLEVPIFSLVKTPLSQLYHMGRSTGLVIDVGSSVASVTPILDGIIQSKSSFHSKYAGDFSNLHALNFLESKTSIDNLIPLKFQSTRMSQSFKDYQISYNLLQDFKSSMLNVCEIPASQSTNALNPKNYQLPNKSHIGVNREQINLLENLFQPNFSPLLNLTIPEVNFNKPQTNGLSNLVLLALKNLESSFIPNNEPINAQNVNSRYTKFNEILRELLSNILITGGSSLTTGLSQRVINDIYKSAHQFFPNYIFTQPGRLVLGTLGNYQQNDINEVWDKKFGSWLGACNLASMLNDNDSQESNGINIALDNWFVTKSDYEELGEDLILEKFK
ncbi:uncharacterized protein AC631_02415 [Debaryomyces fabryi]|uniref:Actin-related protein 4 n=1 Tax=Debaryomyces fabryi TaxID=58627 RepID=A0A0V1Q0V4_9ASCO|nr:uncharacterized protein AC631_02415 [Debaryomyces fabryi]KSA01807.1 hypothetical protein AC631_02415 [Debaryomyces fabryi]CUM46733.1 unnamed protein product [Debaryomyces fabryi]